MRYYVELSDNVNDVTLGRLYAITEGEIVDDVEDERYIELLEDQTGYVVEL